MIKRAAKRHQSCRYERHWVNDLLTTFVMLCRPLISFYPTLSIPFRFDPAIHLNLEMPDYVRVFPDFKKMKKTPEFFGDANGSKFAYSSPFQVSSLSDQILNGSLSFSNFRCSVKKACECWRKSSNGRKSKAFHPPVHGATKLRYVASTTCPPLSGTFKLAKNCENISKLLLERNSFLILP